MGLPTWRSIVVFSVLSVVLCGGLTVAESESALNTQVNSNRVVWKAEVPYEGAVLTIGLPDGVVIERAFSAHESITFSPSDLGNDLVADGSYTWQLVLSPVIDDSTREAMTASRADDRPNVAEGLRASGALPPVEVLVHSGNFRIENRSIVADSPAEPRSAATAPLKGSSSPIDLDGGTESQVIAQDLIVQGSECVGLDCVNNENFGFDTFRLKENNLRINFMDTSNSGSFPTNDWRIVANDSSNGGGNYLAIEDSDAGTQVFRVDAGAGSNALRVSSSGGNVGLGTATPVLELQVTDGDSPGIRLEQNGSSGWTPQTWDIAGNEANFFIRDVTHSSKLPFRIKPNAPTDSIYVDNSGEIGIGTSSPTGRLHITDSDATTKVKIVNTESGGNREWAFAVSNSDEFRVSKQGTGGAEFIVQGDGTVLIGPGSNTVFKLTPTGQIIISSTLTENGTPDYVFADDYALIPVPELAEFIQENGHLPNVPSAREVAENGLDMTQFQLTLLEKIEELTMYIVEQDRVIRELQREVQSASSGPKTPPPLKD